MSTEVKTKPSLPPRGTVVLEAHGIVKRYGHVTALAGTDLELRAGEVLAIVGDNGAGKSTLIKVLCGAVVPDAGKVLLDGTAGSFSQSSGRAPARYRDRLPGSGRCSRPGHRDEPLLGSRSAP